MTFNTFQHRQVTPCIPKENQHDAETVRRRFSELGSGVSVVHRENARTSVSEMVVAGEVAGQDPEELLSKLMVRALYFS